MDKNQPKTYSAKQEIQDQMNVYFGSINVKVISSPQGCSHVIRSKKAKVISLQPKTTLPIVSVYVRGPTSKKEIKTFALLDPGSNMTFCSQDLINRLSIKGNPQPLSLSTLNAKENVSAIAVGLEIAGTSDECQQNLPVTL